MDSDENLSISCYTLPVSSIYVWSENSSPKSEASFVLTAQSRTIERDWNWCQIAPSISAILAGSVPKFRILTSIYRITLWFCERIIWLAIRSVELAGDNGIKAVYDLQSYWASLAAILASLQTVKSYWASMVAILASLQTVPFRPFGPHQCGADEQDESN
jgi:hypothetical protein